MKIKTLVIVESPSKAKTIEKYLGKEYKVLSSVGHIRDLATTGVGGLGVDITKDFEPTYKYITGKKKIVNELIKYQEKVQEVLIATDPDREGEAIAWHLLEVMKLNKNDKNRIIFNEITKTGVLKGIENKKTLDINLVHSQESRRIIDRIIGFKLSALLKKKIKVQSAGRVQSVALRMIVEREEEIKKFISQEYWTLKGKYLELELEYEENKNKVSKELIEKIYEKIKDDKKLTVTGVKTSKKKQNPYKIFTTSTFVQTSINKLNFSSKKAMQVAQKLYEGIDVGNGLEGLITYMRTDSTRISSDVEKQIYAYINENFGKEYVGFYIQKKNSNSQDAHEGIRPTNINNTPKKIKKYLTTEQFKVYNLIWNRTVSALMKPAIIETTTYTLEHAQKVIFKTSDSINIFLGFKILEENKKIIPKSKLKEFDKIEVENFIAEQHFTQPKPRYTEAKLIKDLEENGVGRPSTYATIIDILKKRNYVIVEKKVFIPTEDGILVTEKLREFFQDFINVKYTSQLEEELDKICVEEISEKEVLHKFYDFFEPLLKNANSKMENMQSLEVGRKCPECQEELVERKSKYGTFVGCSGFPSCKYNEIKNEAIAECPSCKKGSIIEKKTKKGKVFFACNNFPKCKYAVWKKEDIGKKVESKK